MELIKCSRCGKGDRREQLFGYGLMPYGLGGQLFSNPPSAPLCFYKDNDNIICSDCLRAEMSAKELSRMAEAQAQLRRQQQGLDAVEYVNVTIKNQLTRQASKYIHSMIGEGDNVGYG